MRGWITFTVLVLFLFLFSTPTLAEPVDLFWDAYAGNIDSIAVERSTDLITWTEIASLPPTDTSYTDDVGAGTWFWRVVAVVGTGRSSTLSGVWKIIEVTPPISLSTP